MNALANSQAKPILLAQLVDHHVAGHLAALGPLRLGLLDIFGDLKFSYLGTDHGCGFSAVTGPQRRFRDCMPR
jgi:hypothetical protein